MALNKLFFRTSVFLASLVRLGRCLDRTTLTVVFWKFFP